MRVIQKIDGDDELYESSFFCMINLKVNKKNTYTTILHCNIKTSGKLNKLICCWNFTFDEDKKNKYDIIHDILNKDLSYSMSNHIRIKIITKDWKKKIRFGKYKDN
jgi:hypothetical protein